MRKVLLLLLLAGLLLLALRELRIREGAPDGPAPRGTERGALPVGRSPASPVEGRSPDAGPEADGAEAANEAGRRRSFRLTILGPDGEPVARTDAGIYRIGNDSSWHRGEVREVRDGSVAFAVADEDGVAADRLVFEVYGAPGAGAVFTEPVASEIGSLVVHLPAPLAISGFAVDEEGEPVEGIRIEARGLWPGSRVPRGPHGVAVTGADGTFSIGGLGDLVYRLRETAPDGVVPHGFYTPGGTLLVHGVPAGSRGIRLGCHRLRTVDFTVLDTGSAPVVGAEVRMRVPHSSDVSISYGGKTGEDGRVHVQRVPTFRIRQVVVTPPDDREDLMPVTLPRLPPHATVRLPPARSLAGIVRDEDGRPVELARVSWRVAGSGDPWSGVETDGEGRFRVARVPVGPIEVGASPIWIEGPDPVPAAPRIVEAGRTDLTLTVPPSPTISLRFVDWEPGETGTAWLHVVAPKPWEPSMRMPMSVGENGCVRFANLREEQRADVLVRTDRGRVWLGRGLAPADGGQAVRGLVSQSIAGRLHDVPAGCEVEVSVRALWGIEIRGRVEADGRFEIPGVPDGTWTLTARGGSPKFHARLEATPGIWLDVANGAGGE